MDDKPKEPELEAENKDEESETISGWWSFKALVKIPHTTEYQEVPYLHNITINQIEALKPVYLTINKDVVLVTKVIFNQGGSIYVKEKPTKILKRNDIPIYSFC